MIETSTIETSTLFGLRREAFEIRRRTKILEWNGYRCEYCGLEAGAMAQAKSANASAGTADVHL